MAESTLTADYTKLRRMIAWELGRPPLLESADDWTSEDTLQVGDVLDNGLNRFYGDYAWSFLQDVLEVPLYAPYATGTVAVSSGVVTGSGTTFPSWAADGDLYTDLAREVATRGGNTSLTLTDLTYDVAAGTSYTLVQAGYTLPDNFGSLVGGRLFYRPGETQRRYVERTSVDAIRTMRWNDQSYSDYPRYFAVMPKVDSTSATDGQRSKLLFWPTPSAASRLLGRYKINPDALDGTNKYALGGMLHSRTIMLACLVEAQLFNEHQNPSHEERYLEALEESIARDKRYSTPPTIGYEPGACGGTWNDYRLEGIAPPVGAPDVSNLT